MVYGMERRYRSHFILAFMAGLALLAAGCISEFAGPAPATTPAAAATTGTVNLTTNPSIADQVLRLDDLPSDYLLRDRTVIAYAGTGQLARDLGWLQGYRVSFYRLEKKKDDMTEITEEINVYPAENLNMAYLLDKEALVPGKNNESGYQVPFPVIGNQSIAWRETSGSDEGRIVTYSVLFTKKNVLVLLSMRGTTTDYELLKTVAQDAADRIR
jgi:hypothetical protein